VSATVVDAWGEETCFVYLLKGSKTQEFYRYSPAANVWETMTPAPVGTSGKPYKAGSVIAYGDKTDGSSLVYLLKGGYNEFYSFDVLTNTWTTLAPLTLIGTSTKKKKAGNGAAMACYADHSGDAYVLKGNNTREFWQYIADSNKWVQLADLPAGAGKNAKGGGSLVYNELLGAFFATKGNNTREFFSYGPSSFVFASASSNPSVASSNISTSHSALRIAPNPFSSATTISYTLPKAGDYSLKLYDVTGTLVTTLASGYHAAGSSSFIVHRSSLSSGIYLVKFATDGTTTTSKLIIE